MKLPSALLPLLLLSSCSEPEKATQQADENTNPMTTLSGSVLYRERMALPPGATVSVTLEDSSKMDAPAMVLATSVEVVEGAPPYPFTLEYKDEAITEKGRYGLRAKIEADGELLFTSDEFIPAFDETREGPVEIQVRRAGGTGPSAKPGDAPASLVDTKWKVIEIDEVPVKAAGGDRGLHLDFTDSSVTGSTGVNQLNSSFETSGQSLSFGPIATTRRAAIDPEISQQEQRFLAALNQVTNYALEGSSLMLKDESGMTRLLAKAVE